MRVSLNHILALLLLAVLSACKNDPVPEPPLEPIGGRDPEALITVSNENWFPENIGIILAPGQNYLSLEAASGALRTGSIEMRLSVVDENMPDFDGSPLNYWEILFPIELDVAYEVNTASDSQKWFAFRFDRGGIRIDNFSEEEGVTYAAGEFHMTPGNGDLNPPVHTITGFFNNVRVFPTRNEMNEYFDRVNALLQASED